MIVFRGLLFIILVCLVAMPVSPALAMQGADTENAQAEHDRVALIFIKKSERRMYLLDEADRVLRSYTIMLGPNPLGHKQAEGDGRTPEGAYRIDFRNENSAYQRSLRISYPNEKDRVLATKAGVSPGGDIFIHGKPNGKSWMFWKYTEGRDWTEGCIAVSNQDMQEIWTLVGEGTEIIIEP